MMRRALFIYGLKTEELHSCDPREYHTRGIQGYGEHVTPVHNNDHLLLHDHCFKTKFAAVHHIAEVNFRGETVHTYIALTDEVQELINKPFDAIARSRDFSEKMLTDERDKVNSMRFVDRLMYLWCGNVDIALRKWT